MEMGILKIYYRTEAQIIVNKNDEIPSEKMCRGWAVVAKKFRKVC
jgi:hypothetical protein